MGTFSKNSQKNKALSEGERAYPATAVKPLGLQVGDDVRFYGMPTPFGARRTTVRAVTEHYALCTWPREQGDGEYTVISWQDGWRGPHGSWGHGVATDEDCRAALAALEAGEIEMSHRHSIHLDISAVFRDGKVVFSDARGDDDQE